MLSKDIRNLEYVIFDIETTGFDPKNDQIIEIGAVKVNGKGEVVDRFQQFVSLYKFEQVPNKIIELTGIDDNMLLEMGQEIHDVMDNFHSFFKDSILVAQNIKFDMSFIDEYFLGHKNLFLNNLSLDTIDLAKKLHPQKESYKLAKLIEYFEVEYDSNSHHRADYDAQLTAEIFIKGMKQLFSENNILLGDYETTYNIEEASLNQKRYLNSLLKDANIILEGKNFLTKFNASRQISILVEKKGKED